MFGKLKKWLGVEGVKLDLELPNEVAETSGVIKGKLHFYSMNPQKVNRIEVQFRERYKRGRGKNKLIDEYLLGKISLQKELMINENEPAELDFEIPFQLYKSRMDEFERKNFLTKGVASVAKLVKNVHSTYTVIATANVEGTVLNPIATKKIKLV